MARPGMREVGRFVSPESWNACAEGVPSCFIGLDLTPKRLTSLVTFDVRHKLVSSKSWLPEAAAPIYERAGLPVKSWAQAGHLVLSQGEVVDLEAVLAGIRLKCADTGSVELAFDPWTAGGLISQAQTIAGLSAVECRPDVLRISPLVHAAKRAIESGAIRHDGNPVLSWAVTECELIGDALGNVKPSMTTLACGGVRALAMSLGRAAGLALLNASGPRLR